MKFVTNLNLQNNELQNARIQNLTAAPVDPVAGQIYFNTTNNRLYAYDGTSWIDLTAARSGVLSGVTLTNVPTVKTSVTMANGNNTDNAFHVVSSDNQALFEVKTNGDTVIGGVLTVEGTGTSSFAGNVNIGGNLTVDGTIQGGTQVDLGEDLVVSGNLNVKGTTTLGDDPTVDTTTIKGFTKITSKSNKSVGSSTTSAFLVESKDAQPLFQVMENGDAKIAGVLTVTSINSSNGSSPGTSLEGDTTAENLHVTGDLTVDGNTILGSSAVDDTVTINGYTTLHGKVDKSNGSASIPVFQILDGATTPNALFEVMENGDTVIAGVLHVNGSGTSTFEGDVSIGGNLTVEGDATVKGVMHGNDFEVQGNLVVDGNTTLGNDATSDTTNIKGKTTIHSGVTKASGSDTINAFEVVDASSTPVPLFEVRQNGDTIVGGSLTVKKDAIVSANMSGEDLTLQGNLNVKGNTTLGDASSDTITVNGTPTFMTNVNMSGKKLTNLADPTSPQDAATKAYVDAARMGMDVKDSVRVATTSNITLSGVQTIDGISLVAGDRVLVKDQTTASQNGIYVVASGTWSRATDADNIDGNEVTSGMFTFVEEGTTNENSGWILTTDGDITVGTTALNFVQFSGAGQITAGDGLTKSGNTLNVVGTMNRIKVNSDSIDIDSNYVGQTSITTLGTVTTGTWKGSTIDVAHGGTGATSATSARSNLGATGKYAVDIGDGASTTYTVTHGLNSQDVVVSVREKSTNQVVMVDVEHTSTTQIKIYFGSAPGVNAYRVVVVG